MASPVDELDGFYGGPRRKPKRTGGTPWDDDEPACVPEADRGVLVAAASGVAVAGSWFVAAAAAAGPEPTWSHAVAFSVAAGSGVGAKTIGPLPSIYAGVGTVIIIAFPHASPIIVPAALLVAGLYSVMRRSS